MRELATPRTRVKIVFRALQSAPCLPGHLYVVHGVCVSVCGLSWKHVLAAFCVNVRRTWGRSHYHPPHPPVNPPTAHLFPASPGKHPPLSLSLCIMVNNTLPHSRSVIAKREGKKTCRMPGFCCFYASKNRQDKRTEPNGRNMRAR